MGVARTKLQKQQQQEHKQTDRQTNKQENIKGMSYDIIDHSAQFLAKKFRLDEEIDNPAASSRSFLHYTKILKLSKLAE